MLFSVIVPVYNVAPYLRACLDSVLAAARTLEVERRGGGGQWKDGPLVEVICVDDGSTDGSGEMLDRLRSEVEVDGGGVRFFVIHQKNAGVSVARNEALKRAQGEYVCFVDADDFVEPHWLEWYARALQTKKYDIVRIKRPWWTDEPGEIDERDVYRWVWNTVVPEGFPWTYCVRREVALKAEFPVGVEMSEDALYLAILAPHIETAYQLATNGYEHVVRGDSAMFKKLSSTERLKYLRALHDIVTQDKKVDKSDISHMFSNAIMLWLARAADDDARGEIRTLWKEMKAMGCADGARIQPLFRWTYRSYEITGWMWPSRLWAMVVAEGGDIKKRVCNLIKEKFCV